MAKAKENYGKMVEIQQEFMDKITANTNKMMEMFQLKDVDTKQGQELINDYVKRSQRLMEEQFHPENLEKFWEKMPEHYNKTMEIQMDFYNRSTELMRKSMEQYTMHNQQEYWKNLTNIYMENYHAWLESSQANMKAMQDFFSNN
jgi:hypothetical protein